MVVNLPAGISTEAMVPNVHRSDIQTCSCVPGASVEKVPGVCRSHVLPKGHIVMGVVRNAGGRMVVNIPAGVGAEAMVPNVIRSDIESGCRVPGAPVIICPRARTGHLPGTGPPEPYDPGRTPSPH